MTVETHPPAEAHPHEVPPPVQLLQMMMGMWVAQIVATIARFEVPELIANGTKSADAIAAAAGADRDGMSRLLRAGASCGLLAAAGPQEYALTPLGECLRKDAPGSVADLFIAEMAPGHWLPWGQLYEAVKSGQPAAASALGMPPWEYYAQHAEEGATFARGMGNLSAMVAQDAARLYDASPFRRIVDVGGSQGVMLRGLLDHAPDARGVLFDRPEVVAGAPPHERIETVGGDFFAAVPEGGDLYVLKSILHDWNDEQSAAILRNVHRAAPEGAKLLAIEMLLPDTPQPTPVAFMDLNMLVMLGGRERTAAELAALLASTGWRVTRVIPTGGLFQLIEAERV